MKNFAYTLAEMLLAKRILDWCEHSPWEGFRPVADSWSYAEVLLFVHQKEIRTIEDFRREYAKRTVTKGLTFPS